MIWREIWSATERIFVFIMISKHDNSYNFIDKISVNLSHDTFMIYNETAIEIFVAI